ncbi:T9SS type A sorting domain-containing protein [Winogradskyella vidalii]|uniref:T9SS type A sorting domain-containing protein n=1 Tax=Winogradskyella vidalii TaxID=2615024 RepID=UPI0015CABEA1|nr:T9SS type A sorting domain-containing protein [Winogradskyella vidalii]
MREKKYIFISLFILISVFVNAQETILCALQMDYIKIESIEDVPSVSNNADGTVTLTHQDQNITDIYNQYSIYDFYQAYPNSNPDGELIKYYNIVHGNRALINDLYNYVSPNDYIIEPYPFTPISSALVNLLDGNTYSLVKICTDSSETGNGCPEDEQNIPDDFQLEITFEYDAENDTMHAETLDDSSCGNSFSIHLKGGADYGFETVDNTLQLWESEPGTTTLVDYSQSCYDFESTLFSVFDIGCYNGNNYGNIKIDIDTGNVGEFVIERENTFFATDFLTFQENTMSVKDENFQNLKIFEIEGNPYLQVENPNNQSVIVEVYNASGQSIISPILFEENRINISNLSTGLYFTKVSNVNNQQKTFKFLKN